MPNLHTALIIISMLFAGVVAILAITGSGALPLFAAVGGITVGLLWAGSVFLPGKGDKRAD